MADNSNSFPHMGRLKGTLLFVLTAVLITLTLGLTYKEDISDFLPLGTKDRQALDIYQDIAGANQLTVLFTNPGDADKVTEAVAFFAENVEKNDTAGWTKGMTVQVDAETIAEVQDFVYANIPYFLTEQDYRRMDSLLSDKSYVARQMQQDKEMLMFPTGGLLSENIGRDPLNLFTPIVARLQALQPQTRFETYDGYIFTPDMSRAIVTIASPFGNAETEMNAQLLTLINNSIQSMQQKYPAIKAHVVGGPQIAVGNATQIKHDSVIAVTLAVVLILALLYFSFRSIKNILLIALSIGWGWLFALGGMALLRDSVSIIVIGISSVILGIAVNYPLHLVAHTEHEPDMKKALKDIRMPLVVGNVTTVGAFLALVPLDATALRDLGTFASLLLIGTIVFVLVYLPHFVKPVKEKKSDILRRIASVELHEKSWLIAIVAVLTVVFGWFSLDVEFDSNMANINYMTAQQRSDMEYFQRLMAKDADTTTVTLYVPATATNIDAALDSALTRHLDRTTHFLASRREQAHRLGMWHDFMAKHHETLTTTLATEAQKAGFAQGAFDNFCGIIQGEYTPQAFEYFRPLTTTVFRSCLSIDSIAGRYSVVDKIEVKKDQVETMMKRYHGSFDVESMNSALANTLSDNFNYIGWACSAIVFFFLWASFRSMKLAIISFVPMAVSWLWILGIMALLGIKFNIVNIILATFIFGQGDDYTIFITEGCMHERKHGKGILVSYRQSILLSALIMFIGIGTLIFAKHPALFSLAEITILGMSCVVFMSWLLPPLMYRLLTPHTTLHTEEQ